MNGGVERAAAAIARWALRIMPAGDKDWAEAMAAELAYCAPGVRALSFALGCLAVALRQRVLCALLDPGILRMLAASGAGLLFVAHAAVDGSGAWPLLWPVAAGAAASLLPERNLDRSSPRGRWRAVRAGSAAGSMASVIFAVGSAGFLLAVGDATLESRLPVLVAGAASGLVLAALSALACSLARETLFGP